MEACSALGYRKLYCETMIELEEVNDVMANDLYDLNICRGLHREVATKYDKPSWRNGQDILIPMSLWRRPFMDNVSK